MQGNKPESLNMEEKYRNFSATQDATSSSQEETSARMRKEVSERHEAMRAVEASKKLTDAENEARALNEKHKRLCAEAEKAELAFSVLEKRKNGMSAEETDDLEEEHEELRGEKEEALRTLYVFEKRNLGMHENQS